MGEKRDEEKRQVRVTHGAQVVVAEERDIGCGIWALSEKPRRKSKQNFCDLFTTSIRALVHRAMQ
jgi:hypothetical protein